MPTGNDFKRALLTTRWLPDHPGIFRQAGARFALDKEGLQIATQTLYQVIRTLWDSGFIERSVEQTSYVHTGGILKTHWYRFASLDRESDKPGWRPGEHHHSQFWHGYKPTSKNARIVVPDPRPYSQTPSRDVKGLPDPAELTWVTWRDGPQKAKTYLQVYVGFERQEQIIEAANQARLTKQQYIRGLIEADLMARGIREP